MFRALILLTGLVISLQSMAEESAQQLFTAMRSMEQPALLELLKKEKNLQYRDYKQRTLLMQAAAFGHTEIAKYLIKNGADVNAVDKEGETPLKHAAWTKNTDIIDLLVQHGADINAKNNIGTTPLWSAVISGRAQMVKRLLELGADPNTPNQHGMSAVRFARSRDVWDVVSVLEQAGGRNF
jgi:ankyrin repeat protein